MIMMVVLWFLKIHSMFINFCLLLKEFNYDLYFRSSELPRNVNTNMCVRTAKAEKRMKERLNQEV